MKSSSSLMIVVSIIIIIGMFFVFYINKDNNLYPNKEFNKVFIPNTKIYNQIQEYTDKMLYKYSGVDRINIFNFHNGSEDIRQIPFLKESIQIKSLRDERFDIKEAFKDYPIPHDLFKINYLYENGFLLIDNNFTLIPKSFQAQLNSYLIKKAVYHILISNEGIPFGYISLENINSSNFQFNQKDSVNFSKDVAELELMFDRLLKENKNSYSNMYLIVSTIGFTGIIIVFVLIGFVFLNKTTNNKIDNLVDFIKPKFELISKNFENLSNEIVNTNNKINGVDGDRRKNSEITKKSLELVLTKVEETGDKLDDIEKRLSNVEHKKRS